MSVDFACGQILFNLKNSNLHYLIKETHLSAFITIRKKFIKEPEDAKNSNVGDDINVTNEKTLDDRIRLENGILKQEINDLKTLVANVEVEKDEIEIKNDALERSLVSLENKLEEEYEKSKKFKNLFDDIKSKNYTLNDDLQAKTVEGFRIANKKLRRKINNMKKMS